MIKLKKLKIFLEILNLVIILIKMLQKLLLVFKYLMVLKSKLKKHGNSKTKIKFQMISITNYLIKLMKVKRMKIMLLKQYKKFIKKKKKEKDNKLINLYKMI